MIAYLPPMPRGCESCGAGPCNDGTLCAGFNNRPRGIEYIAIDYGWPRSHAPEPKLLKILDRHDPRYQHTPRSPKARIRKRR